MPLPKGVAGLRPTAARVRSAIFDRLGAEVTHARVLDLFAGSGALAFEALSRGAAHATLVELDPRVVRHLRRQTRALDLDAEVEIVQAEAASHLRRAIPRPHDLVLVDPPFSQPAVFGPIAHALLRGWLAAGAVVVCERELVRGKSASIPWPEALALEAERTYGQAVVEFLRPADPPSTGSSS
jgi:16S rRNA (guanine966-N2)-methyltransferase